MSGSVDRTQQQVSPRSAVGCTNFVQVAPVCRHRCREGKYLNNLAVQSRASAATSDTRRKSFLHIEDRNGHHVKGQHQSGNSSTSPSIVGGARGPRNGKSEHRSSSALDRGSMPKRGDSSFHADRGDLRCCAVTARVSRGGGWARRSGSTRVLPCFWRLAKVVMLAGRLVLAMAVEEWDASTHLTETSINGRTFPPPGQDPPPLEPRIELNLRPLVRADNRGMTTHPANVELDMSVVGAGGRDEFQGGAAYRLLADVDSGTMRLWQEAPGSLVLLGLCPGEHSVSAWAVGPSGSPLTPATTAAFSIGVQDVKATNQTGNKLPPELAGATENGGSGGGSNGKGWACDGSERQPALPGREEHAGYGLLCRVCSHSLEIENRSSSVPSTSPPGQKRLLLRTSVRVKFGTETRDEGQRADQEWFLELREADLPASVAREFVANILGLSIRADGTWSEVVPVAPTESNDYGARHEDEEMGTEGQKVVGDGERAVRWLTQKLETEVAERQVRRDLKRVEAARTAAQTGQLRIVIGAGPAEKDDVRSGWLVTDIDTLDITESSDFAYLLGADGLADAFLAEHVWEHLSLQDAHRATRNCWRYLRPGGRLRLAVPDPAWFTSLGSSLTYSSKATAQSRTWNAFGHGTDSSDKKDRAEGGDGHSSSGEGPHGRGASSRLPGWLRPAMLAADLRDRHLVQFTPELLANICWSSGLTPVLVEGGASLQSRGRSAPTIGSGSEYGEIPNERGGNEDTRGHATVGGGDSAHVASGSTTAETSSVSGIEAVDAVEEQRWGRIKRSVAGGDPRGAFSIVMDCLKPNNGEGGAHPGRPVGGFNAQSQNENEITDAATFDGTGNEDPVPSLTSPLRREHNADLASADDAPKRLSEAGDMPTIGHPTAGLVDSVKAGNSAAAAEVFSDSGAKIVTEAVGNSGAYEGALGSGFMANQRSDVLYDGGGLSGGAARSEEGGYSWSSPHSVSDGEEQAANHLETPQLEGGSSQDGQDAYADTRSRSGDEGQASSQQTVHPDTEIERSRYESGGRHGATSGAGSVAGAVGMSDSSGISAPSGKRLEIIGPGQALAPNLTRDDDSPSKVELTGASAATSIRDTVAIGDAQATAFVRADEQNLAESERGRSADVKDTITPPLGLNSDTRASGDILERGKSEVPWPGEADEATDDGNTSDGVTASKSDFSGNGVQAAIDAEKEGMTTRTAAERRRTGDSLAEWAAAARKSGRVDPRPAGGMFPGESPTPTDGVSPSSSSSPTTSLGSREPLHQTPRSRGVSVHEMVSKRARAREALLAGNATATLDLCQTILQESPSDGIALLYQGVAMAQSGDRDGAWANMERVLALSAGAEENTAAVRNTARDDTDTNLERAFTEPRAVAVPLDIMLAATSNLASLARARALDSLDPHAKTFFLVEGLRRAAERDISVAAGAASGNTDYSASRTEEAFTDVLVMAAQALEEQGQLTSALRLYQRVFLLGGHRDNRALHGLGGLSNRLRQIELEKRRNTPGDVNPFTPLTTPSEDRRLKAARGAAGKACDWGILLPRPGQVFAPGESVQIEFDLAFLDPGVPSAGSLFETDVAVGATTFEGHNGGEYRASDGLSVILCSYLDKFGGAQCLPGGKLQGVGAGWHILTAEAYELPSLSPLSCPGDDSNGGDHSTRTVRFCVGDIATTCRARRDTVPTDTKTKSSEQPAQDSSPSLERAVHFPSLSAGAKQEGSTEACLEPTTAVPTEPSTTAAAATEPGGTAEVDLPFCFMTLALNAMPFITHHAQVFQKAGEILSERAAAASAAAATRNSCQPIGDLGGEAHAPAPPLPTPPPSEEFWEWHVVEGVAAGRADLLNPYSKRRIPDRYFDPVTGLSVDGTTQYLDDIVSDRGGSMRTDSRGRVHVHRRCGRGRTSIHARPERRAGGIHEGSTAEFVSTVNMSASGGEYRPPPRGDEGGNAGGGLGTRENWEISTCLWRDKIQMVNSVAFSLERECLLVEIDADELWTADQLVALRDMFLRERSDNNGMSGENGRGVDRDSSAPAKASVSGHVGGDSIDSSVASGVRQQEQQQRQQQHATKQHQTGRNRQCAYFDCHFFAGPDLVTVTEDGWGHSTSNEWLRAWVFRPRTSVWLQHAPPALARNDEVAGWELLVGGACIGREETQGLGLVFTHYAYVLEEQVRFKSDFYGHSEPTLAGQQAREEAGTDTVATDAVAEWKALQIVAPPVVLADHLTWLRSKGRTEEPRLLTTVVNRPGSPMLTKTGERQPGGAGKEDKEIEDLADNSPSHPTIVSGGGGGGGSIVPVPPIVPLEPFLRMAEEARGSAAVADASRPVDLENTPVDPGNSARGEGVSGGTGEARRPALTHNVNTRMKEDPITRRRTQEDGGRDRGWDAARRPSSANCECFHLVMDGVNFQVDAATPKGISRVWANVLPKMLSRLNGFEGTCLTFLVRGLGAPPQEIEEAFEGMPSERFSVVHVPPYDRSNGFIADRLMLSWVVRSVGATAFTSTLYTQPFWATTPNVVRVLLIHDVLPEILGWDMSTGEWQEKSNSVALATAVVAVSHHSAKEFLRAYPPTPPVSLNSPGGGGDAEKSRIFATTTPRPVWAAHNAVDTTIFRPAIADDGRNENGPIGVNKEAFRKAAGLEQGAPYVMIVGSRSGYKSASAAYRALGFAASRRTTATSASAGLSLVLVGGGALRPDELELLAEVEAWSHIGVGSGNGGARVDDKLLAAGLSGAVALLHLSLAEGFGLTVLEAFACGCPVIATDIPPVREIAGLPERTAPVRQSAETTKPADSTSQTSAPQSPGVLSDEAGVLEEGPKYHSAESFVERGTAVGASAVGASAAVAAAVATKPETSQSGGDALFKSGGRHDGASPPLEGGLVLVDDPWSATQVWRAVRALMAMDAVRRGVVSEALVRRAKAFDSWQPLADALIKAAVEEVTVNRDPPEKGGDNTDNRF